MSEINPILAFFDWFFGDLLGLGGSPSSASSSASSPPSSPSSSRVSGTSAPVAAVVSPLLSGRQSASAAPVLSGVQRATLSARPMSTPTREALRLHGRMPVEPSGWLGAIVAHGNACQSGMMGYVYNHAQYNRPTQFFPHWGINDIKGFTEAAPAVADRWYVSVPMADPPQRKSARGREWEIDFSNETLWTERFVEWPCPAWAPFSLNHNQWSVAGKHPCWSIVHECLERHAGTRRARGQGIDEALAHWGELRSRAVAGEIRPTAWWSANATRKERFWARVEAYYQRGQWLVWAGEMMRIHAGISWSRGWAEHCALWGLGCATDERVSKKKSMNGAWSKSHDVAWKTDDGKLLTELNIPASTVREYLALLKRHTPIPGSAGMYGQQIATPTDSRQLLDWPDKVGGFSPAVEIETVKWFGACWYRRMQGKDSPSYRVWYRVLNLALSIVGGIMGGMGGPILSIGQQVIYGCVLELVALGPSLDGRQLSKGELMGLVSRVMDGALAIAGELDVDLSFEGLVERAGMTAEWDGLLADLQQLEDVYGWSYSDQAFGGMISGTGFDRVLAQFN